MPTKIEWTHIPGYLGETWNPIRGCSKVSPACENCYAERTARRFAKEGEPYFGTISTGGRWNGRLVAVENKVRDPLNWKQPRAIFVCSMSDLFHDENVYGDNRETLQRVWAVMAKSPQHIFLVLTKRAGNMFDFLTHPDILDDIDEGAISLGMSHANVEGRWPIPNVLRWPLPNVWLGVTAENQEMADARIPFLLQIPAAKRFVSVEPMIGPVNFAKVPGFNRSGSIGQELVANFWTIAGGESGPGARPMRPEWARSLRDQCQVAGVPFFFKSWGEWLPDNQNPKMLGPCGETGAIRVGKKAAGCLLDGKEWRQFPETSKEKKTT